MKKTLILLRLFMIGGGLYLIIEIAWRGYSHPAMYFVGGVCFVLIGLINEQLTFDMSLLVQGLIATGIVLVIEFIAGLVLNVWLQLAVWDYSALPGNLLGQVCVPFAGLWYVLSIAGIVIDDYLRYWFFEEEKPRYRII
jgi:uncharacterized membrane protein